jgi:hypothetical protein
MAGNDDIPSWERGAPPAVPTDADTPSWEREGKNATSASTPAPVSPLEHLKRAVTDIPSEIQKAYSETASRIGSAFSPNSDSSKRWLEEQERAVREGTFAATPDAEAAVGNPEQLGAALRLPADAATYAMSPAIGASRSLLGHTLAAVPVKGPEGDYEKLKYNADLALSAIPGERRPPGIPFPQPPDILSRGERTGNLAQRQFENDAARGVLGDPVQRRAQAFKDEQAQRLAWRRQTVGMGLGPDLSEPIENPIDAAGFIADSMRGKARQSEANVDRLYDTARTAPGHVHSSVFENMGEGIKDEITGIGGEHFIDENTPIARRAIGYIDSDVAGLRIENRADPNPPPNPADIDGINLQGVDRIRRRLGRLWRESEPGSEDRRAMSAIRDAFDNRIDAAVNGGLFTGDKSAIQAWNDARAAYKTHRQTFTKEGPNDPIGADLEKIMGGQYAPEASDSDVHKILFGNGEATTRRLGMMRHIKSLFGEDSPQWTAAKQGFFYSMNQPEASYGQRVKAMNDFLNKRGSELANEFSPGERQLIRNYSIMLGKLVAPQASIQGSNNARFINSVTDSVRDGVKKAIGAGAGAVVGHMTGVPFAGEIGAAVGTGAGGIFSRIAKARETAANIRRLQEQMPLIAEGIANWKAASNRAYVANTPGSQMISGIAAENLLSRLSRAGVDTTAARGVLTTTGQGDQQKQAGGRVGYAEGGDVERPFDGAGQEAPDYDLAAAKAAGVEPDERGHLPDTYKLPNHITFSTDSVYSNPQQQGGQWDQLAGDKWMFTPGPANLAHYSIDQLQDYFNKYEPDSILNIPNGYAAGGGVKVSKAKSNYRPGHDTTRCKNCTMFRAPHGCTAVRGSISPLALCDFFNRIKREAGGRVGYEDGGDVAPDPAGGRVGGQEVIRKYDVPYLAGSSDDSKRVYIDRRVPRRLSIKLANGKGRKWVDPADFLVAHETAEHKAMKAGKSYEKAHHENGNVAEQALVRKHGLDWKHYEEVMDGLADHTEHEHPKNPPPDLYTKPYPHNEQTLLKRLGKHGKSSSVPQPPR